MWATLPSPAAAAPRRLGERLTSVGLLTASVGRKFRSHLYRRSRTVRLTPITVLQVRNQDDGSSKSARSETIRRRAWSGAPFDARDID